MVYMFVLNIIIYLFLIIPPFMSPEIKVYYNGSGYKAKDTTTPGTLPTVTASWDKIAIDNPYQIIGRKVIFYNRPYSNTEYSISYGNNETSIP